MNDLKPAIDELTRIFEFLNDRLYQGSLPHPVITIQTNGRRKEVLGWCSSEQVWVSRADGEYFYEINIVAEHLDRKGLDIAETMNHEMVHLYNNETGVKDVSRQGYFHNKNFKMAAESKLLECEKVQSKGWAKTFPTPEFIKLVEEMQIDETAFYLVRDALKKKEGDQEKEPKEKKKKSIKYQCPKCHSSVRATKSILIACMSCKTVMLDSEGKPGEIANKSDNNKGIEGTENKAIEADKTVNKTAHFITNDGSDPAEFNNEDVSNVEI